MIPLAICLAVALSLNEAKSVCYGELGCFSDEAPFKGMPLPMAPEKIPPRYFLQRGNQTIRQIQSSLELTSGELFLAVHGWNGGWDTNDDSLMKIMSNLAVLKPTADIVYVDWQKGAANGWGLNLYTQPASNTRVIGPIIRQFLDANPKFNPSRSHCIGFSLGSHVCGFFAKSLTKGRLGRITALDPANPNFDKPEPQARVDKSDADFVDVIHTSWCGLQMPVGHVDFWVNDANRQPGCLSRRRRQIANYDIVTDFFGCSHFRAPYLFASSINAPSNCSFKFCPCPSKQDFAKGKCKDCLDSESQQMGYWATLSPNRGEFYGKTTDKHPFCIVKA